MKTRLPHYIPHKIFPHLYTPSYAHPLLVTPIPVFFYCYNSGLSGRVVRILCLWGNILIQRQTISFYFCIVHIPFLTCSGIRLFVLCKGQAVTGHKPLSLMATLLLTLLTSNCLMDWGTRTRGSISHQSHLNSPVPSTTRHSSKREVALVHRNALITLDTLI